MSKLLNEIESQINLRGMRGYGVGHPYHNKKKLGYGIIDPTEENQNEENEIKKLPVKISKAFKKG